MSRGTRSEGSPYAPHTPEEVEAMLSALDADVVEELFDIPDSIAFEGSFDIPARSERTVTAEVRDLLSKNASVERFLGRGQYDHFVPAVVDHLAGRSEFLTSYTQYQPEVSQGFLQALFEYQSIVAELTGLEVANCSLYDAATALGEAATFAARLRGFSGDRILVPEQLHAGRRSVLENYCRGPELTVEAYPMEAGTVDVARLRELAGADTRMIYAESPTVRGAIEPSLADIGDIAQANNAVFAVGTDPIALGLLEAPGELGADVVVGDASVLGMGSAYGMGLGLFATREEYLRQVPGRLVGAGHDVNDTRAYTLTLQTREQHIRRERATSNICTNQAWVALRAAIHAAWLGPDGLIEVATEAVEDAAYLAERLDAIDGVRAPTTERSYFREFPWQTTAPSDEVAADLATAGYAVHELGDYELQACVTGQDRATMDAFVEAVAEVVV